MLTYWYFHYESDLQLIIVNLDPDEEPSCTVIVVTAGIVIVVQFIISFALWTEPLSWVLKS